jgi:hypothetical protein
MFKRLMILATMLAMVLAVAVPASGQLIVIDDVADLDVELCLAIQAGVAISVTGDVTVEQVQNACNDILNVDDDGNNGDNDGNNGDNDGNNGDGGAGGALTQENTQETESGDVDQSLDVTGGGDNSSQCLGYSPVAQTGNAQNQIGVSQSGSESGDFEFDEAGSTLTMEPESSTTCDQPINQAATAAG